MDCLCFPVSTINQEILMARLQLIHYLPHNLEIENSAVNWVLNRNRKSIPGFPQIVWSDGTPFREANAWAASRSIDVSTQTIHSDLSKLLQYANFLEESNLSWCHFPKQRSEQCLVRYRGHLIGLRNQGIISPSCATSRMRSTIAFYKFLKAEELIDPRQHYWRNKIFSLSTFDPNGFERTIRVATTDLSIPNKQRHASGLEDGLQPLTDQGVKDLVRIVQTTHSYEFYLMTLLGITTGARIGTIVDLKVATIRNASVDPQFPGYRFLRVGPGAIPPVGTKLDVTGTILVPDWIYEKLAAYATDTRRLLRQMKAAGEDKDLLLLNKGGRPYLGSGKEVSSAVRKFVADVRQAAQQERNAELAKFKFHMTRATFGTRLANTLLERFSANVALAFVKKLMLHKNESTTLRYIRWVQDKPIKHAAANAFSTKFLGLENEAD